MNDEKPRNLADEARERLTATEPQDAMALGQEGTPPGNEAPATRRGSTLEPRLKLNTDCDELQETLARYRELRHARALRIVEKLNRADVRLTPDDVFSLAGHGSVSRLHVARALVEAGHVHTISAAFNRWLRPGRPAFVPRERPPAAATIALVHRSGGVAVLAHPAKTERDEEIPSLAEAGLDAIEVYLEGR